jgi:hypothetical protein
VPRFLNTGLDKPVSLKDLAVGQAECLANEPELFRSDFETGTSGWEFSDQRAWSVVEADGSEVLRGVRHEHAFAGENWSEVVWRMAVKLVRGNAHLNFHSKDGNRYLVSFREDGTNVTRFARGETKQFGGSGNPHTLGEWHVVEIGLKQGLFYVAVDGYLEIQQAESDPLPPGGIWLEVLDDSEVLFDDIFVCKAGD